MNQSEIHDPMKYSPEATITLNNKTAFIGNKTLYQKVELHVTHLFKLFPGANLVFHNLSHTLNVMKHAMEIAEHCIVSENEKLILITAACFHDTGHLIADRPHHEEASCIIMREFMINELDDINKISLIKQIENCIMATKWPQTPQNLLQQIICDADVYHFGTEEFRENDKCVLEEYILRFGYINPIQFGKDTLRLLKDHSFFTNYCKANLNRQKQINIINLEREILEAEKSSG